MRREHDVPHPAGKDERAERRGDLLVQRHEEGETWVHIGNPGYNVSDDVYAMNDPQGATLFKRLKVALAVKALLGGSIRILRCKSRRVDGVCVPMLATTRSGRAIGHRSSSNQRLQPTAGAKRRVRARRRSAGRG